jgi:CBS domain-containing protein
MQRKVVHVLPDCTIHEAAVLLNKKKISCLPVVDEHGGLKGIVTVADLIRALFFVYEPAEKAGLIPSQSGVC